MTITEPCVLLDMDEATYHSDPCPEPSLSSTMAKTIIKPGGPATLRWEMTHRRVEKREFDFGTAAHAKVLGRGMEVVEIPEEYLTERGGISVRGEARAWMSEQRDAGLIPLKRAEIVQIDDMAEAILNEPVCADLLTTGHGMPEVSMFSIDPETSRWMRGRIDFLASSTVVCDYKTSTPSVDPVSWDKTSWNYGYHIQAAWYLRLGALLGVIDPDAEFWFIAQQKTPPYLACAHRIGADLLDIGWVTCESAIRMWDQCLTTEEWPRISARTEVMEPPYWVRREIQQQQENERASELLELLENME